MDGDAPPHGEKGRSSLGFRQLFPPFVQRYFTRLYCLDAAGCPGEDHYVLQHVNHLLVVGLAPSHPLVAAQPPPGGGQLRLRFTEEALASQVSGKRKRGSLSLKPETTICVCEVDSPSDADGTRHVLSYDIRACVNGDLVEVNERLVDNPLLLWDERQEGEGWVAIIKASQRATRHLVTSAEYQRRRAADMNE
ncbi:unnamed protein product [Vitrella brassicaformis CCMP3155]|uniref:Protein Abitram n=2 Tax=Vitrella brassicaformis TaxID=1169539 RepID=A0A0G4GUG5_VITBC|nr:unnamed protein product [Vitrella brassicaformis CCMP3155]|mmetsp:Transcript_28558/g.71297  ORF Transcript_28558/g.71297 Transcript_28558/m.71297 type:complete len:193 (+) Transcript_28558:83-661(+)|eukprot:CEM34452.1 unnamed protein product [Vitrella brassicaformis CCMP3155]